MTMSSEDLKRTLMESLKDPDYIKVLRDEVLAPIIKSLVSDAVAARDQEICALRQELREVREELNSLEQHSRLTCLNISGIPESPSESTEQIVRDVAAAAGVTLSPTAIDVSHRVGRPQEGRCRPIIVRMATRTSRDALYAARKDLRSGRVPALGAEMIKKVFISENLTRANQRVMFAARQLKRRGKLHSVWTDNCRMKVRLQQGSSTRVIRNLDDLRELVGDEPELSAAADSAGLAPAPAPPRSRSRSPAAAAAGAGGEPDADGFQPADGRGGTRSGAKRGRKR